MSEPVYILIVMGQYDVPEECSYFCFNSLPAAQQALAAAQKLLKDEVDNGSVSFTLVSSAFWTPNEMLSALEEMHKEM